jgi:hypothetical protein
MSQRGSVLAGWATEVLVTVESLDVQKDEWRDAQGAALDCFCFLD